MAMTKNGTKKAAEGQADSGGTNTALADQADTLNAASGDLVKKAGSSEKRQESVYSVDEFCSNAQTMFHTRPECVRAALAEKNITQCSRTKAKNVEEAFLKKEVK